MKFFDTHSHIHFPDYGLDPENVWNDSVEQGVKYMMAVGCTLSDSVGAVEFARRHENIWASIGLHPHEASMYIHDHHALQRFRDLALQPEVKAIGETGLDYHYMHSPKDVQEKLLRFQLDLAVEHNLPLIFHIREAFEDFWCIFDEYSGLKGVVHSFSATSAELDQILSRGLYVGLNGIMTFTKDQKQLQAAKSIPLDRLLLETDAPYLTPVPFRGTICQPKHVVHTAEFLATLRGESMAELANKTTANARTLFSV
jgi:TatD DNase family protein